MHPPFCRLDLEFKKEAELRRFVAAMKEQGWLNADVVVQEWRRSPPGRPGVREFCIAPGADSMTGAKAKVKLPKGGRAG